MIDKIENWITDTLIHKGLIEAKYRVIYKTGIDVLFSFCVQVIFLLIFGGVIDDIFLSILFLLCFATVREYAGGYHAPNRILCFCVMGMSFLSVWIAALFLSLCNYKWLVMIFMMLFHLLVFWIKVPASNTAKIVNQEDIKKFRYISLLSLLFWEILSILLMLCNKNQALQISCTLTIISLLILPCKRRR